MSNAAIAALPFSDAASLVAIARATHRTGDRDLEHAARKLLREHHGIKISFNRAGKAERTVASGNC
jgi:hypothetical protein